MNKSFISVTPDSGSGNSSVSVKASANTGIARATFFTISGGGNLSEEVSVGQQESAQESFLYPFHVQCKGTGNVGIVSLYISLDLYDGETIIDSTTVSAGGMIAGTTWTRTGNYGTKYATKGSWKIKYVNINGTNYTPDQFFNTFRGKFSYGTTEPSNGKVNNVGNYYKSLSFFIYT